MVSTRLPVPFSRRAVAVMVFAVGIVGASCTNSDEDSIAADAATTTAAVDTTNEVTDGEDSPDGDSADENSADVVTDTTIAGGAEDGPTADSTTSVAPESTTTLSSPTSTTPTTVARPDRPEGPVQTEDAAEACAKVEFAYLALLEGSTDVDTLLREGAETVVNGNDPGYAAAAQVLLDAVGTPDVLAAADAFLAVCASEGYERLA